MRSLLGRFHRPNARSQSEQLLVLNNLGDGSTLSLDFTAGALDTRFTFTRSTTATYINSSGVVASMGAAATNDPTKARFDYDPTTLAASGLLIEASATNVCEQGQYLWGAGSTYFWGRSAAIHVNSVNGTAGANAVARIDGPDGGSLTGTSIFKDSGSTFVRLNQTIAVAQNTTYTYSTYVRAPSGGSPYIRLAVFNGGTWLDTTGGCTLSSVTITNTSGGGSRFNGVPSASWVRVWVTFTTQTSQTTATIAIYPDLDTSSAATMYCWGAQVEVASGPSSVIPTDVSQGQRAADVCTLSSTNFSSWFNSTQGTFLATGERAITSNFGRLLSANANNTTAAFDLGASTSGRWVITNTTSQADITAGTVTANTAFKVAGAFASNDAQMAFNGTLGTADTSVSLPTVSQLDIGADRTAVYLNGRIRSIKFWPSRLPNATLQSLTA